MASRIWLLALVLLPACSGGSGAVPPSTSAAPAAHGRTTATFSISIPKATASSSAKRRPLFISPATASITLAVVTDPGNVSVLNETVALTPTAQGCTSTLTSTICTLTVPLNAGSYNLSLATQDANGTQLSAGQLVGFTVVAGKTNAINLVLSGIPAALQVNSTSLAVHGTQNPGFTLYGTTAQKFEVEALDADGNVIVGPGAPTFSLTAQTGSGFAIANPTTTAPNTFALTPPGTNGKTEFFTVTASYPDATCQTAGAVCTTTINVKNDVQTLFVANTGTGVGSVTGYAQPYTGTPITITADIGDPTGLALDTGNDLWVASPLSLEHGGVTEYAPPYTESTPTTIAAGDASGPSAIAFDQVGDLFAANDNADNVIEYLPPFTETSPVQITLGAIPVDVVVGANNDLIVTSGGNALVYAPPYTGTPTTLSGTGGGAFDLALDSAGDLFVSGANGVTE
jgi:hypothetical protein